MKLLVLASLIAGASFTLSAQAAHVDVAPGLWEFTTTMDPNEFSALQKQNAGKMQESMDKMMKAMEEAKAKMTPEQRKQLESMMSARAGGDHQHAPGMSAANQDTIKQLGNYMATGTMTMKSCVTQKDIDDTNFIKEEKHGECVTKNTQLSSTQFKSVSDCTGMHPSHSEADVTLLNSKSYSAKFVTNMTMDNKPMTLHGQHVAKWIASDCGEYANMHQDMEKGMEQMGDEDKSNLSK